MRLPRGVVETHEQIGGVPVIRYSSGGAERGVVLYLHGGAYVLGTAQQGAAVAYLCKDRGPDVVSVEYRLAPEHPFPAAVDDAIAVYRELVATVGAQRLVIVGESAGGGLLVLLLQRARKEGLPMPAAAAPAFPAADLTLTAPSVAKNKGKDMLVLSELEQEARWFAGQVALEDPSVSPLFGSFEGFPPTYIAVGTRDLLHDDARRLAEALRAEGVEVFLDEWVGTIHGFSAMPFGEGLQHRRRLHSFVRDALLYNNDSK
nr:alpha/beta hydrolase [Brevibacterium permense]